MVDDDGEAFVRDAFEVERPAAMDARIVEDARGVLRVRRRGVLFQRAAAAALLAVASIAAVAYVASTPDDGGKGATNDRDTAVVPGSSRDPNPAAGGASRTSEEALRAAFPETEPPPDSVASPEAAPAEDGMRVAVVDAVTKTPVRGARVRRGVAAGIRFRHRDPNVEARLPIFQILPAPVSELLVAIDQAREGEPAGDYVFPKTDQWFEYVAVEAEAYAASVVRMVAARDANVVIELERPRTLIGRLVDVDRRPIGGGGSWTKATIFAPCPSHPEILVGWDAALEPDASFTITLGAARDVVVEPAAQGFEDDPHVVPFVGDRHEAWIELKATPFVSGRVVDPTGAPVAGATLRVTSFEKRLFTRRTRRMSDTTTDSGGRFRATAAGDVVRVDATIPDFAAVRVDDVAVGTSDLEIRLRPLVRGSVVGRIRTQRGEPIGAVAVELDRTPGEDGPPPVATADATGAYRADGLRPGTWRVVYRRSPERSLFSEPDPRVPHLIDLATPPFEIREGETTQAPDLVVGLGGSVFVRVFDDAGAPRRESMLSLVKPNFLRGDHDVIATLSTTAGGECRFDGVPPGTYAIVVGFGGTIRIVEVVEGGMAEVTLGGAKAKTALRVTRDGKPVVGAETTAASFARGSLETKDGRTDENGLAVIEGVPPGDVLLRVREPDGVGAMYALIVAGASTGAGAPPETAVTWPTGGVDVVGEPGAFPKGAQATLTLKAIGSFDFQRLVPKSELLAGVAVVGEDGVARFRGVAEGVYAVEVRFDGRTSRGDVSVSAGGSIARCTAR